MPGFIVTTAFFGLASLVFTRTRGLAFPDSGSGPRFVSELRLVKDEYELAQMALAVEVTGRGDYLPAYAGNLDIMTASAVRVGETLAVRRLGAATDAVPA